MMNLHEVISAIPLPVKEMETLSPSEQWDRQCSIYLAEQNQLAEDRAKLDQLIQTRIRLKGITLDHIEEAIRRCDILIAAHSYPSQARASDDLEIPQATISRYRRAFEECGIDALIPKKLAPYSQGKRGRP